LRFHQVADKNGLQPAKRQAKPDGIQWPKKKLMSLKDEPEATRTTKAADETKNTTIDVAHDCTRTAHVFTKIQSNLPAP
jgi:hypothetical protein